MPQQENPAQPPTADDRPSRDLRALRHLGLTELAQLPSTGGREGGEGPRSRRRPLAGRRRGEDARLADDLKGVYWLG